MSNTSATFKVVDEKSATTLQNVNWTVDKTTLVSNVPYTGEEFVLQIINENVQTPQEEVVVTAALEDGTVLTKVVIINKQGLFIKAQNNSLNNVQTIPAKAAKYSAYYNGQIVKADWVSISELTEILNSSSTQTEEFTLPMFKISEVPRIMNADITATYNGQTATSTFRATNSQA